jgi:glucose-6-phosphate 1-dehydrogenase
MYPFVLTIFGATGDLMRNKLIPALFELYKTKQLPNNFFIIGFSRRPLTQEEFTHFFPDFQHKKEWKDFSKHLFYQQGNFDEAWGYEALVTKLQELDSKQGKDITRIFYLATPPENYETILRLLQQTKLSKGCGQNTKELTRIAIEKPFGKDVETAKTLDMHLADIFAEEQIFRVDHYLGKETVQNMLIFRFANGIFDSVWNNNYIDNIQITFAEKKGIEKRGKFYDGVGELRDIGQNHLLQLVASVAMEMPKTFSKEGVRDVRAKAMQAVSCINATSVKDMVVRGQYEGYHYEKDVAKNSRTETFAAMKFFVNSPRFSEIPFYVRAGKHLKENLVEVSVIFKQTCPIIFKEVGCPEEGNILRIRIQPDEGIRLKMIAKVPGTKLSLGSVEMHFTYQEQFGTGGIDAYQKILLDIFSGEQMLFNRSDELASSWEFIENILTGWKDTTIPVYKYAKGSWGPQAANDLLAKDGRKWV